MVRQIWVGTLAAALLVAVVLAATLMRSISEMG
jgi:hypothetical protein